MENELKVVDIFIGTTLRGSAKGSGRVMYIMRTKRKNGSDYEAAPQIAEYDDTTESASVLYAIRDALQRLNYACTVVIHTECSNVAAAIQQHWPQHWQRNNWKSAKGNPVKMQSCGKCSCRRLRTVVTFCWRKAKNTNMQSGCALICR